jgi:hypothetical protein
MSAPSCTPATAYRPWPSELPPERFASLKNATSPGRRRWTTLRRRGLTLPVEPDEGT